jgi:hypothetical protein
VSKGPKGFSRDTLYSQEKQNNLRKRSNEIKEEIKAPKAYNPIQEEDDLI